MLHKMQTNANHLTVECRDGHRKISFELENAIKFVFCCVYPNKICANNSKPLFQSGLSASVYSIFALFLIKSTSWKFKADLFDCKRRAMHCLRFCVDEWLSADVCKTRSQQQQQQQWNGTCTMQKMKSIVHIIILLPLKKPFEAISFWLICFNWQEWEKRQPFSAQN